MEEFDLWNNDEWDETLNYSQEISIEDEMHNDDHVDTMDSDD